MKLSKRTKRRIADFVITAACMSAVLMTGAAPLSLLPLGVLSFWSFYDGMTRCGLSTDG